MSKIKEQLVEELNEQMLKDLEEGAQEQTETTSETVTEVTSLSKEEERLGQEIQLPSPEELVANSGMAIITNRKHLAALLPRLGKKAMQRAVLAALDLPKDGEPVRLITNEEKLAFRLMQSTIRAMYTVLFYHTSEEIIKKHKEEQAKKEAELCQEPSSQLDG